MKDMCIHDLQKSLEKFSDERGWEKFHSPKNLSMALSVEASELIEIFQWKTEKESYSLSATEQQEATDEVADIFLYLLQVCTALNIDLISAANNKIAKNAIKYPKKNSTNQDKD